MNQIPILTHPIAVDRIRPGGETVVIEADEAARRAIAETHGLPEVSAFTARLTVSPSGARGVSVFGTVEADVVQVSGLSLEPFAARVREKVEVTYAPESEEEAPEEEDIDIESDQPDPLVGNTLDLGAVALEFFALGLDPYPRKPGEVFRDHIEDDSRENPFAALAKLKNNDNKTKG